jgi:hypothetical protein
LKMRGPMTDGSTILLQGVNFHMTTLLEIWLDDQLVDNYIIRHILRIGKKKNAHTYVHCFKLTCAENHSIPWPVGPLTAQAHGSNAGKHRKLAFTLQWHSDDIEPGTSSNRFGKRMFRKWLVRCNGSLD